MWAAFAEAPKRTPGAYVCPSKACMARQMARHLRVSGKYLDVPLPSQVLFDECPAKNVLWGGQAGPGKSHGVRQWLYRRSLRTPGHEGLLLRENWDELNKTHLRKMEREVPLLGGKFYKSDRMAMFPHKGGEDSIIDCGHMADTEAVSRYLSTEYGAIVPDEASQYPVDPDGVTPLGELSTRARKVYTDVNGQTVRPRFMPVSNPGGPSAGWLKDMFISHEPDLEKYPALKPRFDEEGRQIGGYRADQWAYIPAKLDDNPYQDEEYAETLAVLSKWRYEQLRHGDWDVFGGQFFSEWLGRVHVQSVPVTDGVSWFASLDWGYNAPGCCLWWACLPDGHYHIAREHKFQAKSAEVVAGELKAITRELRAKLRYIAADPALWQKTGHGRGESVAETLQRHGLPVLKGDNDRFNGWMRCHELLREAPDGTPWLTVDPGCRYLVRSIPGQRSAKTDPDDVDTGGDDHAVDAWRYGAMSRPAPGRAGDSSKVPAPWSLGWLKSRNTETPGILAR